MSSRFFRAAALAALALICASANGQARLNDTGVMQAYDSGGLWPCTATNTGDATAYPRQDCRFGRDAMALSKTGGGVAGFDFTPLNGSGQAITLANGLPSQSPSCVRDNVTGLFWEVKTADTGARGAAHVYTWYEFLTEALHAAELVVTRKSLLPRSIMRRCAVLRAGDFRRVASS
jgi:hypothetical protein